MIYIQSKNIEEILKVALEIGYTFLIVWKLKQMNSSEILTMCKYCHKIYFRDYWWNPSNPNNWLNVTWEKLSTATIELEEEIQYNTFYL